MVSHDFLPHYLVIGIIQAVSMLMLFPDPQVSRGEGSITQMVIELMDWLHNMMSPSFDEMDPALFLLEEKLG